jgi:hypothetical protein
MNMMQGQMANHYARALLCALYAMRRAAHAIPGVAFPFNSQVPVIARVDVPYSFQLSESTFAPIAEDIVYTLTQQPAWLTFDGATRTLEGTPGQGDVGSETFVLIATDGTGAVPMSGTLVISSDPAPQLAGDISDQIAVTANLSSRNPAVVTLLPSTSFNFDFERTSFIDIIQRELYYYATLADHTPLPSWLIFNPNQLTFSGTAPDLSAFPQSWVIDLIASDVEGFAGVSASFTISIATQRLAFVPEEQNVNITPGDDIKITSLKEQLFRNDAKLEIAELESATASLPSWMSFDSEALAITGKAPDNVTTQNLTVSVVDKLGNSATATVNLIVGNESLFDGNIGSIVARGGEHLEHRFSDSLFTRDDVELSVTLPTTTEWLQFDSETNTLQGDVPSSVAADEVRATMLAKLPDGNGGQTQVFTIDIRAASRSTPTSTETTGREPRVQSPAPTITAAATSPKANDRLSSGLIAAIVLLCLIFAALLIIGVWYCCKKRRRTQDIEKSPKKEIISRPMPSPEMDATGGTTDVQRNVYNDLVSEYGETSQFRSNESAPQIGALDLPSQSKKRRSKLLNRFSRISAASSMGMGEDMIRADANIPEWGQPSAALSAQHDSFIPAAEMARMSRHLSSTSPSKRALSRRRGKSRQSAGSTIETTATGAMARHSSRHTARKRRTRSTVGLSTTREDSSMASFTTRGTSVLSTQTTLPSEFPRPPSTSLSIPALLALAAEKRKSMRNSTIRMVGRSDSINDDRTLDEKRQSFIRNRASKSVQSPLFAHGSRQSSSINGKQNGRSSTLMSSMGSMRRSGPILATYSESSSLEPNHHDSKRLSQRVRSVFAPNFPRALTRSTMCADDERVVGAVSDSNFTTTSESINDDDNEWINDLPKPRHERNFVLPGEASPTPPPAPPASRRGSYMDAPNGNVARPKWKERMADRTSSPLSSNASTAIIDRSSPLGSKRGRKPPRKGRLSEPLDLVSADSMSNTRPKMIRKSVVRPVSVEGAQKRFRSLRAEREQASAGSEQWVDVDYEEDMSTRQKRVRDRDESALATQRSSLSGPAFL